MTGALPLLLLWALPARAAVQLSTATTLGVTHEFLEYDDRITGSSPGSSFLTPGQRTVESLSLLLDSKPKDIAWEGALDGRLTDDPRVDAKRLNLKRLYLKGDAANDSAVVGDFFGMFSNYTLGKSLKGAQYTHRLDGGNTQLTALAGMDKPNWDDLWNHNRTETVDRQVYGARAQQSFMVDGAVGFSVVEAKDQRSAFDTADLAIDQRVFGVDWTLPRYHKLSLSGESAYALSENDQPTTDANGDPVNQHSTLHGWAHHVNARYSYKRFKTVDDFERVSPEYETTVGAASPDLLQVRTNNTWTITGPWKWIILNYTYFHNGLARQDGFNISTTRMPETGLRYEAPDWDPDFSWETKLRHREVTSTQDGLRRRTRSVMTTLNDRFGPLSLELDYEFQHEDRSDGTSSLRHHILGLGSNFYKELAGWKLTEGLRWDLQRDRDNLLAATDQTGTVRANVLAVSPWAVDGGVTYSRTLVLLAQNPGNDRRTWLASLGYNILKKPEHRVELRFSQNDNRFQTPGQDYKEMVWQLALDDKF